MSLVISGAVRSWLDAAERVLGAPTIVTGGDRTVAENIAVGGSPTSDHLFHRAVDFKVVGVSDYRAYQLFKAGKAAGTLPPFDQIIFYPLGGHIHAGLGPRMRGEFRMAVAEGGYPLLDADLVAKLHGAAPALLLLIVLLVLAIAAASQKGA